jgi:hypothetical protein
MALRDHEMRSRLLQLHRNYIGELSKLLKQGQAEGELRDVDAVAAAELLKALLDGVQLAFALGVPIRIDRLVRTGLDIVLLGVQQERRT